MPFEIIRNDLTSIAADAIVNTANPEPVIGAGTDEAIYAAAGREELLQARQKIGPLKPGQCAVTPAFHLPAKYIIHVCGPRWLDGFHAETIVLMSCYTSCLKKAEELHCQSIAFPLISSGTYGFPKDQAVSAAASAIYAYLMKKDMQVILTVFDADSYTVSEKLFPGIREVIDDTYAQKHAHVRLSSLSSVTADSGFTGLLQQYMRRKHLKPARVYRGANLSKQTFSKILLHPESHPTRNTVMALCIGLQLEEREAERLMAAAGYAFIPHDRFDSCIRYFLRHHQYNIVEDNIVLSENGLPLLGSHIHA